MSYNDEDTFTQIMVYVVALLVVLGGTCIYTESNCSSKWRQSGFKTDWGPVKGCLLEVAPGKWIPEERYREFDK